MNGKWKKLRHLFDYVVVGAFSTIVNLALYALLSKYRPENVPLNTGIAFALSTVFAFFGNKYFVFEKGRASHAPFQGQMAAFLALRGIMGLLEAGFMWLTVTALGWPNMPMKLVANAIVIIGNYLFSKLFIFKGRDAS